MLVAETRNMFDDTSAWGGSAAAGEGSSTGDIIKDALRKEQALKYVSLGFFMHGHLPIYNALAESF